ncbi:MAG: hypothetical protein J6K91_05520, partial [Opitutales bacterium]|nr:hypothetical protein [Opitutales bacterium]
IFTTIIIIPVIAPSPKIKNAIFSTIIPTISHQYTNINIQFIPRAIKKNNNNKGYIIPIRKYLSASSPIISNGLHNQFGNSLHNQFGSAPSMRRG